MKYYCVLYLYLYYVKKKNNKIYKSFGFMITILLLKSKCFIRFKNDSWPFFKSQSEIHLSDE